MDLVVVVVVVWMVVGWVKRCLDVVLVVIDEGSKRRETKCLYMAMIRAVLSKATKHQASVLFMIGVRSDVFVFLARKIPSSEFEGGFVIVIRVEDSNPEGCEDGG